MARFVLNVETEVRPTPRKRSIFQQFAISIHHDHRHEFWFGSLIFVLAPRSNSSELCSSADISFLFLCSSSFTIEKCSWLPSNQERSTAEAIVSLFVIA